MHNSWAVSPHTFFWKVKNMNGTFLTKIYLYILSNSHKSRYLAQVAMDTEYNNPSERIYSFHRIQTMKCHSKKLWFNFIQKQFFNTISLTFYERTIFIVIVVSSLCLDICNPSPSREGFHVKGNTVSEEKNLISNNSSQELNN